MGSHGSPRSWSFRGGKPWGWDERRRDLAGSHRGARYAARWSVALPALAPEAPYARRVRHLRGRGPFPHGAAARQDGPRSLPLGRFEGAGGGGYLPASVSYRRPAARAA